MKKEEKSCSQHMHTLKGLKGGPSKWMERFLPLLPEHARVLDFACGCGRNDRLLSKSGFSIVAADLDDRVLPYLEVIPNVEFVHTDLENEPWPFEPQSFDMVLVNFYLYRPRLKDLASLLKPGGFLIYETFMKPYPEFDGNRAKNDDFILKPMELPDTFRQVLETVAYEETLSEGTDCFQRYCGRKFVDGRAVPVRII